MPSQEEKERIASSEGLLSHMTRPLTSQMGLSDQTTHPVHVVDSACGTGVLAQELQKLIPKEILEKSTFLCADSAESAVSLVTSRVNDEGWTNTEVKQLDAMNTGLPAKSFTHVGIGMGLHIIPDPDVVLADTKRILKPGGIFGASTPHADSTFWMPDLRSAFESFPFTTPLPSKVPMQLHSQGD
ncbi:S-adenosyl-L-methionine-dependent methyltransferase [Plectosphaerella plurivora]|uniref:S-adenosyl-L-methionine-dependent methyltransferase n=1 Tax=Plectosphaerella plurivora TaxID=936078 RepID=A0A9P8VLX2_9PEZI|nr:S-adenosyl-L-methionine-dependent methyltransferase [Plectosphaerella plurivora]